MKTTTLTFNKIPSYHSLKNLLSDWPEQLSDRQLVNRYGKLLLALALFSRGRLPCASKDMWLHTNMRYMESIYKQELEKRDLRDKYTLFIEWLQAH